MGLVAKLGGCVSEPDVHTVTAGQPQLKIAKAGAGIGLYWQGGLGRVLQETESLTDPVLWQTSLLQPSTAGDWLYVVDPNAAMAAKKFYRLVAP